MARLETKEGAAEQGDYVVMDYVGSIDGEEFTPCNAQEVARRVASLSDDKRKSSSASVVKPSSPFSATSAKA